MRLFSRRGALGEPKGNFRVAGFRLMFIVGSLALSGPSAHAEGLSDIIEEVGPVYGEAYASPFLYAFGPNQNSNLFATARIPKSSLTIGFGVKVMGTYLNEEDQSFQKVFQIDDLGEYDPDYDGVAGTVVMSGPTIFGDTNTTGQADLYVNGFWVETIEGIPGFWETRWAPLATPEAYIGGLFGLKFTLRYFPSYNIEDMGKTEYLGYGLQWSTSDFLENLPFDLMIGFFNTSLKVENTQQVEKAPENLFDSEANSYFVAVSKNWSPFTLYGGFALEDSRMDVAYIHVYTDENGFPAESNVNFGVDGRQDHRFTLGVDLEAHILVDWHLNLEAGFGDMSTYSAGLMLGL